MHSLVMGPELSILFTTLPELFAAIGQAVRPRWRDCLFGKGCPRFYDLMHRRAPQHFYAFDLMWKEGQDLGGLPLIKRKLLLKKIVKSRCWITSWAKESIYFMRYARGTWRESSPRRRRVCISQKKQLG